MIPHTLESRPRLLDSFRLSAVISGSLVFIYCLAIVIGWYCDISVSLKMLFRFRRSIWCCSIVYGAGLLVLMLALLPRSHRWPFSVRRFPF